MEKWLCSYRARWRWLFNCKYCWVIWLSHTSKNYDEL